MSCEDCDKKSRVLRLTMERLQNAASAHGYELWCRIEPLRLEVLAVPTATQHGTPEQLIDAFKELGQTGLPGHPNSIRARMRDHSSVRRERRPEAGHTSFVIDSVPPFELVFIDKLL